MHRTCILLLVPLRSWVWVFGPYCDVPITAMLAVEEQQQM